MKKMFRMALVAIMMMVAPVAANAQLSDILKSTASGLLGNGAATGAATDLASNLLGNLLGTNKLTESNLVGTWVYEEPCAVLESQDILGQLGSTLITNKLVKKEKKALEKVGFKAGKVILVLNKDKSGVMTVGNRQMNLTWGVSGSNLTLTFLTHTIKINANMNGGKLQLAMNADKLLTLAGSVTAMASKLSSSMGTVSKLLSKYEGMYVGLKFARQ